MIDCFVVELLAITASTFSIQTMEAFSGKYLASGEYESAEWVILGAPFDGTSSFRPGSRFGPMALRQASIGLESYSPYQGKDLEKKQFADLGDLEFPLGNIEQTFEKISGAISNIVNNGKKPLLLGGEHLITFPSAKSVLQKYSDIHLLAFDAHCDFRKEYLGQKFSHACTMHLCSEIMPVHLIGARSGIAEEFERAQEVCAMFSPFNFGRIEEALEAIGKNPLYLSIDLDVIDPAYMPGTGTPEPCGISANEFFDTLLWILGNANVVAADITELSPMLDPSGASSALAAKIAREIILSGTSLHIASKAK